MLFLNPRSVVSGLAVALTVSLLGATATSAVSPNPNTIRITADKQTYSPDQKKYTLNGNVFVSYQDIRITGKQGVMEIGPEGKPQVARFFERPMFRRIKAEQGEDVVVGDVINIYLTDDRFGAEGNVESSFASVAADPFIIRSDVQQFDNRNKVMAASGSVRVDYQGSQAFSDLANVRMNDNGKAERVIFSGGAKIIKDNSEITGDKITVMVDSGNLIAENKVKTRVDLKKQSAEQPEKVFISSDYQQYDKASDTMIASGHVHILYGDYVANGPKATFKLRGGELDRIFLTGRPTITEKGRTITADRITITTNPRNFEAVGNVKVNFQTTDRGGAASGGGKPPTQTPPKGGAPSLPVDDPSDY